MAAIQELVLLMSEIPAIISGLTAKVKLRNAIIYGGIGIVSSSADAVVFLILMYVGGLNPLVSNAISVSIGITTSFVLNRNFNFKVYDHALRRALIFFAVGLCGLGLSQLILFVAACWGVEMFVAKLVSIVIVAGFQFLLNSLVSFGLNMKVG